MQDVIHLEVKTVAPTHEGNQVVELFGQSNEARASTGDTDDGVFAASPGLDDFGACRVHCGKKEHREKLHQRIFPCSACTRTQTIPTANTVSVDQVATIDTKGARDPVFGNDDTNTSVFQQVIAGTTEGHRAADQIPKLFDDDRA